MDTQTDGRWTTTKTKGFKLIMKVVSSVFRGKQRRKHCTFLTLLARDVKRGQNLEAETRAMRPRLRPRPGLWGQDQGRG